MVGEAERPASLGGDLILDEDNFLRRMPLLWEARQKLIVDALVHVSDCLYAAFDQLRGVAIKIAAAPEAATLLDRAQISNAAWSIVDDLYTAKQLVENFGDRRGPVTTRLLKALEPAAMLRNGMDHLSSGIGKSAAGNLVKMQGARRAIFGAVSFLHVDAVEESGRVALRWINVASGPMFEKNRYPMYVPGDGALARPVDCFHLSAFATDVDLSVCVGLFRDWIRGFSRDLEQDAIAGIGAQTRDPDEMRRILSNFASSQPIQIVQLVREPPAVPATEA